LTDGWLSGRFSSPGSNEPESEKRYIPAKLIKKGLRSLDNPMLRGSFTLVLSPEKMDYFDVIANQAFSRIVQSPLVSLHSDSSQRAISYINFDKYSISKVPDF